MASSPVSSSHGTIALLVVVALVKFGPRAYLKWKGINAIGMAPTSGKNGVVTYLYGVQQPSVVCAVLQVCDVALQTGEQVNSINLGDTARWSIEPAITGSGINEIQHQQIATE